jgi:hypothetical protein
MSSEFSSPNDFDFFIGNWKVSHRRLKERLAGCTQWETFSGTSVAHKVLGGLGNIDDNYLELPTGAYRAVTLRSFDTSKRQWAIWWLDGRNPWSLDVPVTGSFIDGVGQFFASDVLGGQPILVRFIWRTKAEPPSDVAVPRWEQAFSPDNGTTWETNWTMDFLRVDS